MGKVAPKADVRWTMNFREKYAAWFREAKAQLEAHHYPSAFKTYPFPALDHTHWAPGRTEPVRPPRWVYVRFPRGGQCSGNRRMLQSTVEFSKIRSWLLKP